MTRAAVRPSVIRGTVKAPPSKSYTHRALVAGFLTERPYRVKGPLVSDDTNATARALEALGTQVERQPSAWTLRPRGRSSNQISIDCGESGTTLRFVATLAAKSGGSARLSGHGRLPVRPMAPLVAALRELGATVRNVGVNGRSLPLEIRGPIHGGSLQLDASKSSQFASSLLLTLPTLEPSSRLRLVGPIVSEGYLESTLSVLRCHRVQADRRGRTFVIPGGQAYHGNSFTVPGDASSAAYLLTAAAVSRGAVRVLGISPRWPQADLAILDLLRAADVRVSTQHNAATVEGGSISAFDFDFTGAPDLYPLAGVLAALADGTSHLRGAPQVADKESDRRGATKRLARAIGATVVDRRGDLLVRGTSRRHGFELRGETDHRVVMSAAVGALAAEGPSTIEDASVVSKSFPGFWDTLRSLGAEVEVA